MREEANSWLDKQAVKKGTINGQKYWIVPSRPMQQEIDAKATPEVRRILQNMKDESGYNGYIHFKKRPVREKGYHGIVKYVPVWGGITYAKEDAFGMVYGFDTCHIMQENLPIKDMDWTLGQIKEMRLGLLRAKANEKGYLLSKTDKAKARYAEKVYGNNDVRNLGYSALIDNMFGKV